VRGVRLLRVLHHEIHASEGAESDQVELIHQEGLCHLVDGSHHESVIGVEPHVSAVGTVVDVASHPTVSFEEVEADLHDGTLGRPQIIGLDKDGEFSTVVFHLNDLQGLLALSEVVHQPVVDLPADVELVVELLAMLVLLMLALLGAALFLGPGGADSAPPVVKPEESGRQYDDCCDDPHTSLT
jgi:hypothetical protein